MTKQLTARDRVTQSSIFEGVRGAIGRLVPDDEEAQFLANFILDMTQLITEAEEAKAQALLADMEGLVPNMDGINPNNKDFYDGYKLATEELRTKLREYMGVEG